MLTPTKILSALFLCLSVALTACNDKYPTANIPDTPLEKPLDIIIEPKKVAMTATTAVGVKDDGTLWTWDGSSGNIASGGFDPTPKQVEGITDVVAVSAGIGHILMLKKDGSVWGWGSNYDGYVDPNDDSDFIYKPRRIEGVEDIVDISAGSGSSVFLNKNGEVFYLGSNEWKILKNLQDKQVSAPIKISGLKNIARVDANSGYILALDKDGNLFTTACKEGFQKTHQSEQGEICQIPFDKKVVDFAHGITDFALLDDGTVWAWGDLETIAEETNNKALLLPRRVKGLSQVVNISNFSANTVNGDLYIWGDYLVGKSPNAGESSMYKITKPTLIANNLMAVSFVRNAYISALLTKNGEVWAWEGNRYGQRGTGKAIDTFYKEYVFTPEKSLFTTH
ncbi:RCC1 domain-containing protein [Moraxella oblonga]|uniref:RCC1 domain-containing protein n=1 Tax=Moraxella oblonga TaxID=200413 RepID=UPI00083198CE|nr:hypothetical protein [Moraxella oblonga]